mmetsp:Transcript_24581/g.67029  ORF Transcript_24581/g.67029 Transcript_24581/m.67029 type:complete len:208 (-) Transcript_24581:7-630(-)
MFAAALPTATGAASSITTAATSLRTLRSSTTGLGAKWKCVSASSLPTSAWKSMRASLRTFSSLSSDVLPTTFFTYCSSYTSPRPLLALLSSRSISRRLRSGGGGSTRTTSSNWWSAMRRLMRASMSAIASSVGSGGGFTVVSKSTSTSRALLSGRCPAATSPRKCHSFSAIASASSSRTRSCTRSCLFSCVDKLAVSGPPLLPFLPA